MKKILNSTCTAGIMVFWADTIADDIINRNTFKYIETPFSTKKQVVETGTSISGIPHLGNASDVVRGEAITRALKEKGVDVDFIWVADDMDPFRKVPSNLDQSYKQYLGMPVCSLPDPDGCCKNYVQHYVNLFMESLKDFGVTPEIKSGHGYFTSGEMVPFVRKALERKEKLRQILNKYREEDLPEGWIPYSPICQNCGKIATPVSLSINGDKISYICKDTTIGDGANFVEGCGFEGDVDITKGQGKLPWKPEWAARWALFGVTCEPFGKEHATIPGGSFWVNGEICEHIFDWPEPYPVIYEFVLGKGGEKMSSSKGNTITTWEWPKIAPVETLKLFFYKKLQKQREFDFLEIPSLADEFDQLERIYFNKETEENDKKREHLHRLYELCQVANVPKEFPVQISFKFASIISQILSSVPENEQLPRVIDILKRTNHLNGEPTEFDLSRIKTRLLQAGTWAEKHAPANSKIEIQKEIPKPVRDILTPEIKIVFSELAEYFSQFKGDAEELNTAVFDIATKNNMKANKVFQGLYRIFLGKKFGPRIAQFLLTLDAEFVEERLRDAAK